MRKEVIWTYFVWYVTKRIEGIATHYAIESKASIENAWERDVLCYQEKNQS